jgi:putative nucleotidyltransferase with HDIG domain
MTRVEALELLKSKTKNDKLIKHMLAVSAVMRALAKKFGEDEETWATVGLLHDIDYAMRADKSTSDFTLRTVLKEHLNDKLIHHMESHDPEHTGVHPKEKIEKALYISDPVTGLIVAAALVQPDKKLANVKLESLLKKFRDKDFARGARREQIEKCKDLDMSLEEFLGLALKAMQDIAPDLGL